jgi:hypothetical protein
MYAGEFPSAWTQVADLFPEQIVYTTPGPQHTVDHTTAHLHGFVEQLNNRRRYDQTAPLYY